MKKPTTHNSQLTTKYLPIVGLEIHAELKTKSKMFCGCKNDPFHAAKPNIYTCPVCLGMPGGLPVANKKAVEWTIKLGVALNCKINLFSKFDRKNYFYPDLAKGYQISQYDIPFCEHGIVETEEGPVRIRRIHLEEDTGKLQHKTVDGKKVSLIDFNRGGVPLIEIVTEPDIHSANHAKAYAKKLRQILRHLDISDCDMEQGSMRLEANISLLNISPLKERTPEKFDRIFRQERSKEGKISELQSYVENRLPNYKVEVKNINSFNFLAKAIDFEIIRHQQILEKGETPKQETRGWDEDHNQAFSQRSKEDAEDYRYFPDPDLPPIRFTNEQIEAIGKELPELPDARQSRWRQEFEVEEKYSRLLVESPELAKFADRLFSLAKKSEIKPNDLANAWVNKKINITLSDDPKKIIKHYQQTRTVDEVSNEDLSETVQLILNQNPEAVEKYKSGKVQIIGFLIGQTMQKIGKKVDAKQIKSALEKQLQ